MGGNVKFPLKLIATLSALVVALSAPSSNALATGSEAEAQPEPRLFAVVITIGPNWDGSKSPNEQAFFQEHSANLRSLREAGHIVMGARFSDKGLIIFSARSAEEISVLMDQDPSMTAGTFVYEIHAFNVFYPGLVEAG